MTNTFGMRVQHLLCENTTEVDGITLQCDRPATVEIMGERDSFGCEWLHFCEPCANEVCDEIWALRKAEDERRRVGTCPMCHQHKDTIRRFRDSYMQSYEDDAWGCKECIVKVREDEDAEMAYYDAQNKARALVDTHTDDGFFVNADADGNILIPAIYCDGCQDNDYGCGNSPVVSVLIRDEYNGYPDEEYTDYGLCPTCLSVRFPEWASQLVS